MEIWQREALFGGMSANAFKLGMVLTRGWFWVRVKGCTILYRGSSMDDIDFAKVIAIAQLNAKEISVPSYISHDGKCIYFYVARRANQCGQIEQSLSAAVKIALDSLGNLEAPVPNGIIEANALQTGENIVRLCWQYCPIAQKAEPKIFRIYSDNGSGRIDYENPAGAIDYDGARNYIYQAAVPGCGLYQFAIRAEDGDGAENQSTARIVCEVTQKSPPLIDVLYARAL